MSDWMVRHISWVVVSLVPEWVNYTSIESMIGCGVVVVGGGGGGDYNELYDCHGVEKHGGSE
jgi:hypothetical protein